MAPVVNDSGILGEEIFTLFCSETTTDLRAISDAIGTRDWSAVFGHAHRIRGRARVMGFQEYDVPCAKLEEDIQNAEYEKVLATYENLQSIFVQTSALLDQKGQQN